MEKEQPPQGTTESIAGDMASCAFLETAHLFKGLEREDFNHLCSLGQKHTIVSGVNIITEGQIGDRMYLVVSGHVLVVTGKDDAEIELALLSKGAFFGEVGLLTENPRTATVRAKGEVVLISFGRDDLEPVLRKNTRLRKRMQSVMTARAQDTIAKTTSGD